MRFPFAPEVLIHPPEPSWVAPACQGRACAQLGFDGATETIGTVEMLALQVKSNGLGFFGRHGVQHQLSPAFTSKRVRFTKRMPAGMWREQSIGIDGV